MVNYVSVCSATHLSPYGATHKWVRRGNISIHRLISCVSFS